MTGPTSRPGATEALASEASAGLQPDPYRIPEDLFGHISPELPAAIGHVVMLSALAEARIGQLLGILTPRTLESVTGRDARTNATECAGLLSAYDRSAAEERFRNRSTVALEAAIEAIDARNSIVHSVWSKAGIDEWSGWKPLRRKQRTDHWLQDYQAVTPDDFGDLIARLCWIVGELGWAIGEAGPYSRP